MKKASMVAIFITTFFYLCCGCFGYAAFGNDTPGNLLTGFGFFEPFWLIDLANAFIILHLVGGYQVLLMLHIKSNFKSLLNAYAWWCHDSCKMWGWNMITDKCRICPLWLIWTATFSDSVFFLFFAFLFYFYQRNWKLILT